MRIFVLSWFFPPATTSEGMVTYKLLRNSANSYVVCSSTSNRWTYGQVMSCDAFNIETVSIQTDDLDEWVAFAVATFEKMHAEQPFDAFMTRTMPPEALVAGRLLHEEFPDVPWIASIADPVGKDPYQIRAWIFENEAIRDRDRMPLFHSVHGNGELLRTSDNEEMRRMYELKQIEDYAVKNARALIFPHDGLMRYVLGMRRHPGAFALPHSFDRELYPSLGQDAPRSAADGTRDDRITISFVGFSDNVRSLEPVVLAMNRLHDIDEGLLDKLHIRFIGNVPMKPRVQVYNCFLQNCISIENSVDYRTSLQIIQESDWALHIDARFDFLETTGKSIFFAGKLADYMATDTPILSVTGKGSPAYYITESAGGVCVEQDDLQGIAEVLVKIARGELHPQINRAFRDSFDAVRVACIFDEKIEKILQPLEEKRFERRSWPVVGTAQDDKIMSICVPSYNMECFLDRCLHSLMSCAYAPRLQVIVVNDGSRDGTRAIAEAYEAHYPGIVSVVNKENGGHGSTINAALARATGLYFRVIDADDWVDSKEFDKMLSTMEGRGLFPDLVSSNYYQVIAANGDLIPWGKVPGPEDYVIYDFAREDFTAQYFTMHSMVVKTEVLQRANFKIQEHTYYVDTEYILFPIPYVETVMFSPEFVYRYYVGQEGQSINPDVFVSRFDQYDRVLRRMLDFYREHRDAMGEGQRSYMKTVFSRELVATHYRLTLIFDTDAKRGSERARIFDAYLKEADPEIYEQSGRNYPALQRARLTRFNPADIARIKELRPPREAVHEVLRTVSRTMAKTEIGEAIVYNRFTEKLSHGLFG